MSFFLSFCSQYWRVVWFCRSPNIPFTLRRPQVRRAKWSHNRAQLPHLRRYLDNDKNPLRPVSLLLLMFPLSPLTWSPSRSTATFSPASKKRISAFWTTGFRKPSRILVDGCSHYHGSPHAIRRKCVRLVRQPCQELGGCAFSKSSTERLGGPGDL